MKYVVIFLLLINFTACSSRIDIYHFLLRSDQIKSFEQEKEIISKASLELTADGRIRVIHLRGTAYERGYQHGYLLRKEVQANIGHMYKKSINKFKSKEIFVEAFERLRPYIPEEYVQEMHGLAHGARVPLEMIHHIHALPSVSEWGGKKKLKEVAKKMFWGDDLGPSCSNFTVERKATNDDNFYAVRILDWGLHKISKLHEYPLLIVTHQENGKSNVNVSWVGFIGAVSGMNSEGITLGEMGHGDPPHESLRGMPMIFLLRDVLKKASNLSDARKIISKAPGTNSFGFLISDGKTETSELYIKDRTKFLVFKPGQIVKDERKNFPGIDNILYAGHYEQKMQETLLKEYGLINLNKIQEKLIPDFAMKSNFHNVIYKPSELKLWVNNAKSADISAAHQPYTEFILKNPN